MTDESKPEDQKEAQNEIEDAEIVEETVSEDVSAEDVSAEGDSGLEEPAPEHVPAAAEPTPRRSGFFPMLAGGVLSAGLGFFAGQYNGPMFGEAEPDGEDPIAALESQIAALQADVAAQTDALGTEVSALKSSTEEASGTLGALQGQVEALAAAEPAEMPEPVDPAPLIAEAIAPFEPLPDRLDAVGADLRGELAALAVRVEEIEKQPTASGEASSSAIEAFERNVDELRAEVQAATSDMTARIEASEAAMEASMAESLQASTNAAEAAQTQVAAALAAAEERASAAEEAAAAEIAAAEAEAEAEAALAEAAAAKASALAALSEIEATLQTGEPYEEALTRLTEATGEPAPEVLAANAAEGLPTLLDLNASFGPAANAALSAVRSGDEGGGIGAALANRFNVRSSTPREGDDPDAVLSRMDAAISGGDFESAFAEAEALPEEAQAALADWMAAAEARTQVQAAIADLRTMLSTD